ncbi:MAG: CBS domain-containing protein [Caldimonas sp.]
MLNQPIRRLFETNKAVTAAPLDKVFDVACLMLERGIGAVMIVENGVLVGIFTLRDIVFRVVALGRDVRAFGVGEVMMPAPVTIGPDEILGRALLLMREHHVRHLPVVENGKPIGIVAARDALDPDPEDFLCERRREALR